MGVDQQIEALRNVIGGNASEDRLRRLLSQANYSVDAAINLYYDASCKAVASSEMVNQEVVPISTSSGVNVAPAKRAHPENTKDEPLAKRKTISSPLAERMRPSALKDLLGQDEALNHVIKQALQDDSLPNLILWGPPGSGKTSFAHIVSTATKRTYRQLSAAKTGVKELRDELSRAQRVKQLTGASTVLFVDEIHRWSKAQQDVLLADAENGTISLISATTENPSFSINNAIISRSRLLVFGKLATSSVQELLQRALIVDEGMKGTEVEAEALKALAVAADGDARVALNGLELMVTCCSPGEVVKVSAVQAALQKTALYDRNGDFHYDLISAMHKSLRGGCVDGALYYIARMLTAGEDPRYVTRRLIRFASEDVGLADPNALCQAVAADQSVLAIGMPEAGVVIAQCAAYLALAPKSTAVYRAYNSVVKACQEEPHAAVPLHVRNAPTKLMKELDYKKGYVYNPDNGYVRGCEQGYLPKELSCRVFFDASDCEPGHALQFCSALLKPTTVPHASEC